MHRTGTQHVRYPGHVGGGSVATVQRCTCTSSVAPNTRTDREPSREPPLLQHHASLSWRGGFSQPGELPCTQHCRVSTTGHAAAQLQYVGARPAASCMAATCPTGHHVCVSGRLLSTVYCTTSTSCALSALQPAACCLLLTGKNRRPHCGEAGQCTRVHLLTVAHGAHHTSIRLPPTPYTIPTRQTPST